MKVETIKRVVAGLVLEATGQRSMDYKKTMYRARFWEKRGKSMEQVLDDGEWDRRIEFGLYEPKEEGAENLVSQEKSGQGLRDEWPDDGIDEGGLYERRDKGNDTTESRKEFGGQGEDVVSDEDEEGWCIASGRNVEDFRRLKQDQGRSCAMYQRHSEWSIDQTPAGNHSKTNRSAPAIMLN